ncbi:DIP1984 family protein [Tianweitania sp.]|uniref:DIP1984 family protein n=1 Tax=Tianweitania sp. TaxID=2021634 RepID=UPI0028A2B89D|nr:DIP1984 family protein [Tianweitania sp.]
MKLAEALVLRSDVAKRMEQVKARALRNAKVQEGDQPAEDPSALMDEYDRLAAELETLISRINRTNSETPFMGATLTEALAKRDVLRLRQAAWRDVADSATVTQTIKTKSEVRFKPALDVRSAQKQADDLSRNLRNLDAKIQEANWLTPLSE